MVTISQIKTGIEQYMDREILPHLSTGKQIGLGIYTELLMVEIEGKAREYLNMPAIKILGLSDEEGNIDLDRLQDVAARKVGDRGKFEVDLPIIGRFTFSQSDVVKLCELIRRAS